MTDGLNQNICTIAGRLPTELGNKISSAIFEATQKGMGADEAACVAVAVAADYARASYGDGYLVDLTKIILARSGEPFPEAR